MLGYLLPGIAYFAVVIGAGITISESCEPTPPPQEIPKRKKK